MSIITKIVAEMGQSPKGIISFETYMKICLFDETFGYYTGTREKIGTQGDFYTSSNIGTVMGESLASWIAAYLLKHNNPSEQVVLAEWGGGNGRLAAQVLDELENAHPTLYARTIYRSHEQSPYHREMQKARLAHYEARVKVEAVDMQQAKVFVWANELIDAFPVRRLRKTVTGVEELFVNWDGEQLGLTWLEVESEPFANQLALAAVGQQFEYNPHVQDWLQQVCEVYPSCTLIVIDYGADETELLAPHRMLGTFVTYHNHQVADNPLAHPGEQDLTAHVNFTQVREQAESLGFSTVGIMTQKQFLIEAGILQRLQSHSGMDPFSPAAKRNRAIRQLLLSDQMSELFKVYIAEK
jgi:SAM-dependent MidA family methyltransferase